MCKLFIATGSMSKGTVERAIEAANRCFARSERDGFGFMSAAFTGAPARGRYLCPDGFPGFGKGELPTWLRGPCDEENTIANRSDTLIVHGRQSTNVVSLPNVHPFKSEEHYLAHNGILRWKGEGKAPAPTCDSEQFLVWLKSAQFAWDSAVRNWSGFGAIAMFDARSKVLTIAQEGASLYCARRTHGGWVFATDDNQLRRICKLARIALDTRPIKMPTRLLRIKRGVIIEDRHWPGFAGFVGTSNAPKSQPTWTQDGHGHWIRRERKTDRLPDNDACFPDYQGSEWINY